MADHHPLDGHPEDFPHREEAKVAFRALWHSRCLVWHPGLMFALDLGMTALMNEITVGWGPLWEEFIDTLPGFDAHCAYLSEVILAELAKAAHEP